jgi:hypothetical protein
MALPKEIRELMAQGITAAGASEAPLQRAAEW